MEKWQFIIPKGLNSSLFLSNNKCFLILAGLFFVTSAINAHPHDFGCRVGNRIFQNYDTAHVSPTNFQVDSDGNTFPNGYANVDEKCDDGGNVACIVYNFDETTIYGEGFLADFSIDYCPIDDDILILFIFTISLGLIKLLKPG